MDITSSYYRQPRVKARGSHAEAVSTNMCDRDCQTILWGESGTVVFDADGECSSCICGEGCLAHNILGVASCVPAIAHVVLVCVGLVTSAGSLCHATYNLNQQVRGTRIVYALVTEDWIVTAGVVCVVHPSYATR